jgi:hypothetical protein
MRRLVTILMLLLPYALTAGSGQEPVSAKARVTVYRFTQFAGGGFRPSIFVDEKDVARVDGGRYLILALAPGRHSFMSNDMTTRLNLDLQAGQDYYIRVDMVAGAVKFRGSVVLVPPEQGALEVKAMAPSSARMIKDNEFLAPGFKPSK